MSSSKTREAKGGVLVLGGGFAGSYVARELGATGTTIVNPTNFMLYTPLLPEAAAGSLEPRHVAVPLRAMAPRADLVLGSAVALDGERRVVHVESEAGSFELAYADLVIALGAVTRMPDLPGLREHAFGLKDLSDAIRLRNHVLRQIELADAAPEHAARRLTFVFAGAGFAGVEVLAELRDPASHGPQSRELSPQDGVGGSGAVPITGAWAAAVTRGHRRRCRFHRQARVCAHLGWAAGGRPSRKR